eukprot:930464-Prymnesium_polylepis.1
MHAAHHHTGAASRATKTALRLPRCGVCARYIVWARGSQREPPRLSFGSSQRSRRAPGSVAGRHTC